MKLIKGSYFSGYLQIQVIGDYPEHFLDICATNGIMLWEIRKINDNQCTAMVRLKDLEKIRKLRYGEKYKIRFTRRYGLPFVKKRATKKKPLLIGLLLSVLLFILLSNMVWQVTVTGVPEEVENRIYDQLASYGIRPGAFTFSIDSPNQIQQLLLEDVPELLWVGVEKKGTSFYLEGVEKLIIKDEEPLPARNLIANKSGVIKSMYVKKGLPEVSVNDFVEKGDLLVSGAIEKISSEEDEQAYEFIAADGEIVATTWYRAEVSVPIDIDYMELTGKYEENYSLGVGTFTIPIWPWHKENFDNEILEIEESRFELFGFQFPISFITEKRSETIPTQTERTKEDALQIGIKQAKDDLLRTLDSDAKIISEKVLHEITEHGKVKLSLYITVEENIAIEQPINQGD